MWNQDENLVCNLLVDGYSLTTERPLDYKIVLRQTNIESGTMITLSVE